MSTSARDADSTTTGATTPAPVTTGATTTGATTTELRMTAAVQDRYGPPREVLRIDHIDRPTVGPDDVLVRMRATSVNTPDWIAVTGIPGFVRLQAGLRRPRTRVRGTDVAGTVEAVGIHVTDLAPGDDVFGSWWDNAPLSGGTFAELTAGPASHVITKPAALSFTEAGGAGMAGLTALVAMRDAGEVGPGSRVLINGASGGVGTFAVQIAAALGAHVTGVCSTRNLELVRSLGADDVIDYTRDDYTRGDRRYDVILDNVMNHPPGASAGVLAPGGILIPNSVGTRGGLLGGAPRMARAAIMGLGRTDVRFAGGWVPVNRDDLAELAALLDSGAVRTVIDKVYALDRAGDAVTHVLGHHARGKVVLVPEEADT